MTDLGLSAAQLGHANTILGVGAARHATEKDLVTAIMVALDESSLQNYANSTVPESLTYPHDNVGSDSDSVGLFQQRPSQGWGTVAELMDPATAAGKFYDALFKVPGRDAAPSWVNAQRVQRSFDPTGSNYMAHYPTAVAIVGNNAPGVQLISDAGTTPGTKPLEAVGKAAGWLASAANWRRVGVFVLGAVLLALAGWKVLEASGALTGAARLGKAVIL